MWIFGEDTNDRFKLLAAQIENDENIFGSPKKINALVLDTFPDNRLRSNLLMGSVKERVPQDLIRAESCDSILYHNLANRIRGAYGCNYSIAKEIVNIWIVVLNIRFNESLKPYYLIYNDYIYHINCENEIVIDKCLSASRMINIPTHIDGRQVVALGDSCFENSFAEQIVIPDTVKLVGNSCFA